MQLASKMRHISAQLDALLTDDLWLRNARHSNRTAKLLERELKKIPDVEIAYKVGKRCLFADSTSSHLKTGSATSSMTGTSRGLWLLDAPGTQLNRTSQHL
jgi:threonine aldolase